MKKLLFFLFALTCYGASAQEYRSMAEFGTDEAAYMRYNFIDRQDRYIGKPLSDLLADYELPLVVFGTNSFLADPGANGRSWFNGAIVRSPYPSDNSNPFGEIFVAFRPPLILAWNREEGPIVRINDPHDSQEWIGILKDCIVDQVFFYEKEIQGNHVVDKVD